MDKPNEADTTMQLFQDLNYSFTNTKNTWKIKQNDKLDFKTNFIYSIQNFAELMQYFATNVNFTPDEKMYAEHRWRNLKRHDAWLALVIEFWPDSRLAKDPRDKSKDFSIRISDSWIDFDLKVTRYPQSIEGDLDDESIARWMYVNQSSQNRFHLKNRVFVIAQPESSIYEYELAQKIVEESSKNLPDKLIEVPIPNIQIIPKAIILRV